MLTILSKDPLRAKVEAQSNGKRTILYSASGEPNYMYVVPRFYMHQVAQGLGHAVHPAFVVNGQEKSEFFYACYVASLKNNELVSQPYRIPATRLNFYQYMQAAANIGLGWHISTNAEWAALLFYCRQHGFLEYGNNNYGGNIYAPTEQAQRADNKAIGDTDLNAEPFHISQTAPDTWQHDNSPFGIADLCGNLWEWQNGMRLVDGEIQIVADNDSATACSLDQQNWQAIDFTSGQLSSINTENSCKYDAPQAITHGNAGTPIIRSTISHFNGAKGDDGYPAGLMDAAFNDISCAATSHATRLLQILGLLPYHSQVDGDQVYLRNYGTRYLLRGGAWYSQHNAGLRTLCLSHAAAHVSTSVGARCAYIA